jgi:hypothetical protein
MAVLVQPHRWNRDCRRISRMQHVCTQPCRQWQPGKIGTPSIYAGSSRRMPTIYSDILIDADTIIDDEGVELPDTCVAPQMALELLGQAILDGSGRDQNRIARSERAFSARVSRCRDRETVARSR